MVCGLVVGATNNSYNADIRLLAGEPAVIVVVGATNNSYNADGTLVAQTQSSITTRYVHDLAAPPSAPGVGGSGIRDREASNNNAVQRCLTPDP